ncbi:MAG: D-alanine--D-alanine ligase [Clostridia bacterium]|nr:D-alanine--D-alanine ligase [Clostridia bacterium]
MKIAVLAGGVSPEHDVSMRSGRLVASALARRGHKVALCDVMLSVKEQKSVSFGASPDEEGSPPLAVRRSGAVGDFAVGDGVIDLCKSADVCFLALHGGAGEDGHIQALLDSFGIVYTGSGMAACHSAMDKYISKLICRDAGLAVPRGAVVRRGDKLPEVKFPAVIKPCSAGSSVGVSFADCESDAIDALSVAFEFEDRVLIEEKIAGREFSVSVLGGRALPSVEIIPHGGAYDFLSKYKSGMTDEICPGRLTPDEETKLGRLALASHEALGLSDFSRSDFIYNENKNIFFYLETNSLPGMTENSLMPLAARRIGIEYGELCETICALALERKKK